MTDLRSDVKSAYDQAGARWAAGPDRVYDVLATALVTACPVSLAGLRVLDLGAGTGAGSRAILAAGGTPYAVDLALGMLRHNEPARRRAVVGDVTRLPIRDSSVGAAIAPFVINHLAEPERALAEAARVVAPGGPVCSATFDADAPEHPAKALVERVLVRRGYVAPAWRDALKNEVEPRSSERGALGRAASAAGLVNVTISAREIDVGATPSDIAGYRLGMAPYAEFIATLSAEERAEVRSEAVAAVCETPPLRPTVLLLTGLTPS